MNCSSHDPATTIDRTRTILSSDWRLVVHLLVVPDDAGRAEPYLGLGETIIGSGQELGWLPAIGAGFWCLVFAEDCDKLHGVTSCVVK